MSGMSVGISWPKISLRRTVEYNLLASSADGALAIPCSRSTVRRTRRTLLNMQLIVGCPLLHLVRRGW